MAVHQLGGKTDVICYDGAHTFLIEPVGARAAQPHADAARREERLPKGKVLVDTEASRQAESQTGLRPVRLLKQQFVFLFE